MKKTGVVLLAMLTAAAISGCGVRDADKTVKIAVMENTENVPPLYEDGIKKAVEYINQSSSETGLTVECVFYGGGGSYEEGAATINSLAKSKDITAVIGSTDMDINKTAAHVFNDAGKLFIVPFSLYDSVYEDNNYSTVFSMCNSAGIVGKSLRYAVQRSSAKRWAVCAMPDEFSTEEMNGFIRYETDDGIQIVDCVNIETLKSDFDRVYGRWEALGVEGVMMFPRSADGFELLKKIKSRNPNMVCGGDTSFDNFDILTQRPDIMQIMPGFIVSDDFTFEYSSDDGDDLKEVSDRYQEETGKTFDTWFLQGFNAVKMVTDTALEAGAVDGNEIAGLLHQNGYNGLCQEFSFDEKGMQTGDKYRYYIYSPDGSGRMQGYEVKKDE